MPFTLAHPAAVLILARGPLNLLALCAGAVAPDLPYYVRATPLRVTADSWYEPYVNATSSHSLGQVLSVGLPLALLVYLGARFLLPPLRSIAGVESRDTQLASGLAGTLVLGMWVVVSLAIGVLTHLAWDELTEVDFVGGDALQHGSTALGLVILAIAAYRRRQVVRWHDSALRRNLVVASSMCALGALGGAVAGAWPWLHPSLELSTGTLVEGVLASGAKGAGVGLVITGAALALAWWVAKGIRRETVV